VLRYFHLILEEFIFIQLNSDFDEVLSIRWLYLKKTRQIDIINSSGALTRIREKEWNKEKNT